MSASGTARQLTESERAWIETRAYLRENRMMLDGAAARTYPALHRVADSALLANTEWLPVVPFSLEDLVLELTTSTEQTSSRLVSVSSAVPARETGERYAGYAEAIGALVAPAVFEDRPTYRLLAADLTAESPWMRFGLGTYFDSIDVGEAAAHEFVLGLREERGISGVRSGIDNPCDPQQRPVNLAITTVTIRRDPASGEKSFLLHWRDPRKVGHAGGMYQAVPVGIFQPSGYAKWNVENDFSLWRNMTREFAEELAGAGEDHGSENAPIDYEAWEFAATLDRARRDGTVTAYCLGLGTDPLTFATDLLTAVVIDGAVFDALFGDVVSGNDEGQVLEWQPFTTEHVHALIDEYPVQAAGVAALRRAVSLLS
ncbi:hypothetical protein ACFWPH_26500 [Nocardia sp. NPDC058499]|uniref:hypothetical protein n=1 Tax=Nocardia sp. NPDC058499 TaxID=3346530 RepID=UPI0036691427